MEFDTGNSNKVVEHVACREEAYEYGYRLNHDKDRRDGILSMDDWLSSVRQQTWPLFSFEKKPERILNSVLNAAGWKRLMVECYESRGRLTVDIGTTRREKRYLRDQDQANEAMEWDWIELLVITVA